MRTALHDSPTIVAAAAALRSAQQGYVAQRGALFPQVDAQFQAQREAAPGAAFGLPQAGTSTFTLFDAAVNVTYKFDLVGATRRELEALAAQTDYQRWQLEAARLTLAANVVTTAITAASLNDQVAATKEILATERDQLAIIQRQRDRRGRLAGRRSDPAGTVSQLEATLPGLQKSVAQAGHRLAVLSGQTPDHANTAGLTLAALTLPAQLPLSLPAKLVRQRPDVLASESQLHQASAQAGVATANLYPQLTLSGSIGSETTSIIGSVQRRDRRVEYRRHRCCSRCFTAASCAPSGGRPSPISIRPPPSTAARCCRPCRMSPTRCARCRMMRRRCRRMRRPRRPRMTRWKSPAASSRPAALHTSTCSSPSVSTRRRA